MVSKHIKRDWTGHKEEMIRPSYEYIGVEIFSFDHKLTQIYPPTKITKGTNYSLVNHRHLKALQSKDKNSSFVTIFNYNCKLKGEYRIDILYEGRDSKDYVGRYTIEQDNTKVTYINQKKILNVEKQIAKTEKQIKTITDRIKELKKKIKESNDTLEKLKEEAEKNNTSTKNIPSNKTFVQGLNLNIKTLQKQLKTLKAKLAKQETTVHSTHRVTGSNLTFDGDKDWLKRKTLFKTLKKGNAQIMVELPYNCYFLGAIVRRVITLTGDNEDSLGTVLMLKDVEFTYSNKTDPVEAKIEIGYDDAFENELSESGYYIDYVDEVNIYCKETADYSDTNVIRRFGGYISGFNIDEDRSKLTLNCSDRLQDGENKYLLATMLILQGTGNTSDTEKYYNPINFNSYGQALKFLCDAYEITLSSNIKKNYLVDGEKYNTGLSLKYGKKKDIKYVAVVNAEAKMQNKFVTLRNNPDGKKAQAMTLYNAKDHAKRPIQLRKINPATNEPVEDADFLTFHMTYGLGDPKTEKKNTTIDKTSGGVGTQNWSKCGVSADGKYVMGIGTVSSAKDSGHYGTYYKGIFKNKCPYCHKSTLRWDSCRSNSTCIHGGSKASFPVPAIETEITCTSCDCDFSVMGNEKDSPWRKLSKVSVTQSSKSEQDKLHNGKLSGVAKSGVTMSPDAVLKEVAGIAKKYRYELGTTSSYSAMKKSGKGDCWAFSDLIFTELKKRKVNCRILQYATAESPNGTHRSVQYQNAKNEWVSFPYRKYGLSRMLVQTSNWRSGLPPFKEYKGGGNIAGVTSSSSSGTETTTVTTTLGYDRDKPINGYIEIAFSTKQSFKAKQYKIYLDFTLKAGTSNDWSGLPNYWVNNAQRQVSVSMKGFFDDNYAGQNIFLQSIRFMTPKIKTKTSQDSTEWYKFDDSTQDFSSCKMDLYQIIFDNKMPLNPTDLQSTGKSINTLLEEIIKDAGYTVRREYGKHRCNDKIHFGVDHQTAPKFIATEGDDNNILEWSNISYKPVSDLKNKTICVFKKADGEYSYVDTGNLKSIIKYGEQTTLQTISEQIGSKEAYFNAKNSDEYNPEQSFSYTIIVPYAPNLNIDDLVEVISNRKTLNAVQPVKSIKVHWTNSKKPTIQTEIGLGELEPYLRIKKEQEKLRKQAKAKTTYFSRTATPVEDEDIYIWDN